MTEREVVIIGGGPAGLAAAIETAKAGAQTLVIDENRRPGGQLFKQIHKFFGSREHNAGVRGVDIGNGLLAETTRLGVEVWLNSAVIGLFSDNRVSVLKDGRTETIQAKCILIATGASENAIRFEGWQLPGIMGAGAAQTMINVNRVLPGRRVLMVGSGNVGVIVAYQLLQAGAEVVGIVEGMPRIGAYGVHASKVRRAGVPFFLEHTVVKAIGNQRVEKAIIASLDQWKPIVGTERAVNIDVICIAAGLRPLTDLTTMAGAKMIQVSALGGLMPWHNSDMETSVPGIFVAGDSAGVEEANTAMDEGRLAGIAIAAKLGYLLPNIAQKTKDELRGRLVSLRQGPFGARRLTAKQHIVEMRYTNV